MAATLEPLDLTLADLPERDVFAPMTHETMSAWLDERHIACCRIALSTLEFARTFIGRDDSAVDELQAEAERYLAEARRISARWK